MAMIKAGSARKSIAGYTLTESLMTVAILGILAGAAAPIMVRVNNFWRQTTARNAIERDVRHSLDQINRFLRQGDRKTINIDQAAGQPPFSRITFSVEDGSRIQFYQSGNKLYLVRSTTTVTTSLLSDNVGFIAFTYPRTDDTSIVSVALTMQAATYLGGKKALQLSISKVRIMN